MEEKPTKADGNTLKMSEARREKRVTKLSHRMAALERILDIIIEDHEAYFAMYVSLYRIRHGCDPDTADIPADYLDQVTRDSGPE